jgi:hypothetical protein
MSDAESTVVDTTPKKKTTKKAIPKGQPSITSFFGTNKPSSSGDLKNSPKQSNGDTDEATPKKDNSTTTRKRRQPEKSSEDEAKTKKKPQQQRKPRAKKEKKEKPKAKRGRSAFIIFSMEKRPQVKAENPEFAFGDITKELGRMWQALSAEDKKIYQQKAEEDKQRVAMENAATDATQDEANEKPKQSNSRGKNAKKGSAGKRNKSQKKAAAAEKEEEEEEEEKHEEEVADENKDEEEEEGEEGEGDKSKEDEAEEEEEEKSANVKKRRVIPEEEASEDEEEQDE